MSPAWQCPETLGLAILKENAPILWEQRQECVPEILESVVSVCVTKIKINIRSSTSIDLGAILSLVTPSCGGTVTTNNTYFINTGFPATVSGPLMCSVTVNKLAGV